MTEKRSFSTVGQFDSDSRKYTNHETQRLALHLRNLHETAISRSAALSRSNPRSVSCVGVQLHSPSRLRVTLLHQLPASLQQPAHRFPSSDSVLSPLLRVQQPLLCHLLTSVTPRSTFYPSAPAAAKFAIQSAAHGYSSTRRPAGITLVRQLSPAYASLQAPKSAGDHASPSHPNTFVYTT